MLIFEWKGVSAHIRKTHGVEVPVRTLQRWHKKLCALPIEKSYESKQGRVIAPDFIVDQWFLLIVENFPTLYNVRRVMLIK
jgi:hypothetical protein